MLIEDSNAGQSHPVATPVRKRPEPAQSVECLDSQPEKKCNDLVLWKMQVPMMAPLHLNLKLPQLMPRSQRNNQRKRSPHLLLKIDLVA